MSNLNKDDISYIASNPRAGVFGLKLYHCLWLKTKDYN